MRQEKKKKKNLHQPDEDGEQTQVAQDTHRAIAE